MALLIRAPLTSFDDDVDGSDEYGSSLSSGASSPSLSPSPPAPAPRPRAALLGAPRVAAQLSSSATDDEDEDSEGDLYDDAADFAGDEVLEEVSNGFFRVARVPPPPLPPSPSDGGEEGPISSAAASASGESEYFGAAEGSSDEGFSAARSAVDVFDAGAGSGLEEEDDGAVLAAGRVGDEGSLDGSFLSSMSTLDDGEGSVFGNSVNLSDGSVMKGGSKQGGEDVGDSLISATTLSTSR